jgi:type II secretory pathway predicted ATPase ExeA
MVSQAPIESGAPNEFQTPIESETWIESETIVASIAAQPEDEPSEPLRAELVLMETIAFGSETVIAEAAATHVETIVTPAATKPEPEPQPTAAQTEEVAEIAADLTKTEAMSSGPAVPAAPELQAPARRPARPTEEPMRVEPPYRSASYNRTAEEILSAIARREKVVLLTGEAGSGKTTLCRAVIDELDHRTFTALISGPFDSIEDVLRAILADLGVISDGHLASGPASRASLRELRVALRDFLRSIERLDARAVVFVDEAQSLSADLLQRVCAIPNIDTDRRVIQIVLVGQPALLTTFEQPELRPINERVSVRCELGPLSREETDDYIAHRQAAATDRRRITFDKNALEAAYGVSHGVPGLVERLRERTSKLASERSTGVIDRLLVDEAARDLDLTQPAPSRRRRKALVVSLAILAVSLVLLVVAAWAFPERAQEILVRIGLR